MKVSVLSADTGEWLCRSFNDPLRRRTNEPVRNDSSISLPPYFYVKKVFLPTLPCLNHFRAKPSQLITASTPILDTPSLAGDITNLCTAQVFPQPENFTTNRQVGIVKLSLMPTARSNGRAKLESWAMNETRWYLRIRWWGVVRYRRALKMLGRVGLPSWAYLVLGELLLHSRALLSPTCRATLASVVLMC